MSGAEMLKTIAESLRTPEEDREVSVRTFLSWFGAQRRGYWIVKRIRGALEDSGLTTTPDFESAYIDANIYLSLRTLAPVANEEKIVELGGEAIACSTGELAADTIRPIADPTHSISKLAAANTAPVSVTPNASLAEAVTLMMSHDFSQLPVMTNDRTVKGAISWTSIGSRLALGSQHSEAHQFMEQAHEIRSTDSLFQAVPIIVKSGYVLVRSPDNRVCGIVTASDLSQQFLQLAHPFLLLGEIENQVRQIIGTKFSLDDLKSARDPSDEGREVESVSDLTFGEYIRLLENPERWQLLNIKIDRATFCRQLDEVRRVRNDVMHFDPDGIPPEDERLLTDFSQFLQRLQQAGSVD